MITFLTHEDFEEIARCLDRERLGKQRLEARQILEAIISKNPRWVNQPIYRLWVDYPYTLARYGHTMSDEWRCRGYLDNQLPYFRDKLATLPTNTLPWWSKNEALHESHRSVLIQKKPSHYRMMWPTTCDHLNYYYPTKQRVRLVCLP